VELADPCPVSAAPGGVECKSVGNRCHLKSVRNFAKAYEDSAAKFLRVRSVSPSSKYDNRWVVESRCGAVV
jgi:hypothetical protein